MTGARPTARGQQGLRVKAFAAWSRELAEALTRLPEAELCPHGLFAALMDLPWSGRRKIFLMSEGDEPVAIVPLDYEGGYWKPSLLPSTLTIGPAKDGRMLGALRATGLAIRVGYWPAGLPAGEPNICEVTEAPTYRLPPNEDPEPYWRSEGRMHGLNQARNRCKGFTFEVDGPGAVAWTINNWGEKWGGPQSPAGLSAPARILAGEHLEPIGRHHAFRLLDGSRPVAGLTGIVREGELMLLCSYRDPAYDWNGVGNRLMELSLRWGVAEGLAVGLGGGFTYKEGWAPRAGSHQEFSILPRRVQVAREVERRARGAARPVRRFVRARILHRESALG
jgi:Acetyltransferase (GNAT) domain